MIKSKKLVRAHWKALSLIVVAALALVSGAYAYLRNSVVIAPSPATSSATSYPLELRMELNKTQFSQGELINPYVYLKNISNRTVQITAWKIWLDFKILSANNSVIYQWTRDNFLLFAGFQRTLKPNEQFIDTLLKTEIYDRRTDTMNPIQLPVGTYKIMVFIPSDSLEVAYLEPRELVDVALQTPPATINIM